MAILKEPSSRSSDRAKKRFAKYESYFNDAKTNIAKENSKTVKKISEWIDKKKLAPIN